MPKTIHFIGNILFVSEFATMVVIDELGISINSRLAARISLRDRLTYCVIADSFFFSVPKVPILVIDETS